MPGYASTSEPADKMTHVCSVGVHSLIATANGDEWHARSRAIHTCFHECAAFSESLHCEDTKKGTDLTGQTVYAKSTDNAKNEDVDMQDTRYDIVNNWQVNYVRGECTLRGELVAVTPTCYNDECLFGGFFAAWSGDTASVLDVGCNTGKNLVRAKDALTKLGVKTEVGGIEYSSDSVAVAQNKLGKDLVVQGDAADPNLVTKHRWSGKFSVVQCTAVLQHMTPEQATIAIQNMAECLVSNGTLLVTFKDAPTRENMTKYNMKAWAEEVFLADRVPNGTEKYMKDGYLRAVMWDDDYYPGVASTTATDAMPYQRDPTMPGNHLREFYFYSLPWIQRRAAEVGLTTTKVEVHPDSKIPFSALHWMVLFARQNPN